MNEIGGFFQLEEFYDNEYYKDLLRINTGRNALLYILKTKKIKRLYIPIFLCDSVYKLLKKYNYEYEFYKIREDFKPDLNTKFEDTEYLYIVNYYGQLNDEDILKLKEIYGNIIIDNTHSFFQRPLSGIDIIYNCRKWFGVSDGAYLFTDIFLNEKLEKDISKSRINHLIGRYEGTASEYYEEFQINDAKFEKLELKLMSNLTHNLLKAVDYENIKRMRLKNYEVLATGLKEINLLSLKNDNIPFCYPLYIRNGKYLRKKLIENKIYIPLLWPNVLEEIEKTSVEYSYANDILPIPCDQRYSLNDMKYVVKIILEELKNEYKR